MMVDLSMVVETASAELGCKAIDLNDYLYSLECSVLQFM